MRWKLQAKVFINFPHFSKKNFDFLFEDFSLKVLNILLKSFEK